MLIHLQRHEERLTRLELELQEFRRLWQAIKKPIASKASSRRGDFINLLDKYINEQELIEAAWELRVDYDSLPYDGKRIKAIEMIKRLKRENREYQLIDWLQKKTA